MTNYLLAVCLGLVLALAVARPEREDWGWGDRDDDRGDRGRGGDRRPPHGVFGQLQGEVMRQMKGALMDFIGADMYGEHVFKKMTVILTPEQQKAYQECAKAAFERMKEHKDNELRPIERELLMDRALGICMLKGRFGYTDEQVEKLECCSVRAYFHIMIDSERPRGPKHVRTPPGFRMVEAEFGCLMNMSYGFSIQDLKNFKKCMMEKEDVKDESDVKKLMSYLAKLGGEDDEEPGKKKGPRALKDTNEDRDREAPHPPSEADVEECLKKVKPDMSATDAKDIAFVNTKKREMLQERAEKESAKVEAAKRLLSLLEKAKSE